MYTSLCEEALAYLEGKAAESTCFSNLASLLESVRMRPPYEQALMILRTVPPIQPSHPTLAPQPPEPPTRGITSKSKSCAFLCMTRQ